ncbi:MAG TPA: PIG-L family deacetylase [Planctomycetaceae bacterium]|nr:PIG-L family deacetylase [Planctomycetaceae bacterium]
MPANPLRLLVIGAHPDDCEYKAGGLAALARKAGHVVRFVSVTNGDAGHHKLSGAELADRRRAEALVSGRVAGVEYEILGNRDGRLEPTLAARFEIIGLIRRFAPDLILTHRPNDYHPDHRVTSQLVCDAAYMVTVPPIVPEVPALRDNPIIAYLSDDFAHPYPFAPDVVIDVDPVVESIVSMLDAHESQFYEWLPYNRRCEDQVPLGREERRQWLADWLLPLWAEVADRYRPQLVERYGAEHGNRVKYAEAFEGCEYGAPLTPADCGRLFPPFAAS